MQVVCLPKNNKNTPTRIHTQTVAGGEHTHTHTHIHTHTQQVLEEIERVKRQVEERCSEESRGLAKHLDSVREQLKEADADRHRLSKQAVLLKEQLRESQALIQRSQQTHNVEYIKNITVKYLETKDQTLLRALSIALQISPEEMARVERGQAKGWVGSFFG
jgi:hypothetical protein